MENVFSLIKEANDEILWMFSKDVHELILDKYFSTYFEDALDESKDSIEHIVETSLRKNILDVGCGHNHFKFKFPGAKFTSIDPYIDGADYKTDVTEYQKAFSDRQYDCILAIDSINFGPKPKILAEIEAIDKLTEPEGIQIWRVNNKNEPRINEKFPISELIQYFKWDRDFIQQISKIYDYELIEYIEDSDTILFVMKKSAQ
jgi:hypothetical protein